MIQIIISTIAILVIILIIIYKLDRWEEFTDLLKWMLSKKKAKTEKKDGTIYKYCPYCSKKLQSCPYCKVTYCTECGKKLK